MKKKFFLKVLLFVGGGLAALLSLSSCADYDDDIDYLQEQINSLSSLQASEISTVESSISSLQSLVSSLSSELSSAEAELEAAISEKASSSEVDALQSEVASIKSSISSLENAIATLEASLEGDIAALETGLAEANASIAAAQQTADDALSAATTANETLTNVAAELESLQSSIAYQLTTLESKVKKALDDAAAALAETASALNYIEALQETVGENSTKISALETAQAALETSLTTLEGKVSDAEDAIDSLWAAVNAGVSEADLATIQSMIDEASAGLQEQIDDITEGLDGISAEVASLQEGILSLYGVGKQLKSLVFSPTLYVDGIESIEVAYLQYDALAQYAVSAEEDGYDDEPYYLTDANGAVVSISVAPIVEAEYYTNPSNAAIETAVSNYKYVVNSAISKSDDVEIADQIVFKNVERKTGAIEVTFKIQDAGLTELLEEDGTIEVAALQYTDLTNDTTITSDFARLYVDEITDFYINKVEQGKVDEAGEAHLATTAADAIDDLGSTYPMLSVQYESSIDLAEYINVHRGDDELWGGEATLAKSDFYMTYELVGWFHGTNETSESVHASLEGSVLAPTPISGAKPVTTVGRLPLVRVTLWDGNGATAYVVAVGYILVEITEDDPVQSVTDQTIELTDVYVLACGSEDITVTTKWDEIEVKLYSLVEMSKDKFESVYSLEGMEENGYATQYYGSETTTELLLDPTVYTSEKSELLAVDYIGTVELTTDNTAASQTEVITWAVSNEVAYDIFVEEGLSELVTYVKFASNQTLYPDIYVKLVWAPANAPVSPVTVTILNDAKIVADWHDNNSRDAGFYDIHFEVGNPTDPNSSDDYDPLEINGTFKSGETPYDVIYNFIYDAATTSDPKTVDVEVADNLSTDIYTFETSQDVAQYKTTKGNIYYTYVESATSIGVVDDPTYPLVGTYTELATLDQTTGEVTLVSTDIMKEILNSPEYGDYETSLTFTVGLIATTCEPGDDFFTAEFESGDLDVIVVKPLYITEAKVEGMQWNDYSSLTQDLTISLHDYNGYDDKTFYTKSNKMSTIDAFYGISEVVVDYTQITDNYDGTIGCYYGDKYSIEANISMSVDGSTGALTFGTVTLTQDTSSRSTDFEIYLPVALTYDWGTIYATVTVYVSAASGK